VNVKTKEDNSFRTHRMGSKEIQEKMKKRDGFLANMRARGKTRGRDHESQGNGSGKGREGKADRFIENVAAPVISLIKKKKK